MTTVATTPATGQRALGRGYFWAGIGVSFLGLVLVGVQLMALKVLIVPWYSPILATLGAFFLFVATARRRSIGRVIALVLIALAAGFQWFFLGVVVKLPEYHGPAQAGKILPAFSATLADGLPFTDADLRDGSRHVLTFFRGRW